MRVLLSNETLICSSAERVGIGGLDESIAKMPARVRFWRFAYELHEEDPSHDQAQPVGCGSS